MRTAGSCFALALCLAPQARDAPRFRPREGATVDKTFAIEVGMRLVRLQIDERDFTEALPPTTITLRVATDTADTYERVGEDRPLALVRRFRDIDWAWKEGGVREHIFGFHPLWGCTVRYRWQPRGGYAVDRVEGRCRQHLLDGLIEDFDLRGLLPGDEARGASWVASGRPLLESLFAPGILASTGIPEDRALERSVRDVLVRPFLELGEKQAELRCTPVEIVDAAGARCMRIALAHSDRYALDVTEEINACLRAEDPRLASWELTVVDFRLDWRVGGEGELVWNLDEGRCESLDLEAPLQLEGSFELWFDRKRQFVVRFAAEGECAWTVRVR